MNLIEYLEKQIEFSRATFGPGARVEGVTNHIEKELAEVRENPTDLFEWIDLVILSLDGAWRAGYSPEEIVAALSTKLEKNISRTWPDWRSVPPDTPIEHIR